MELLSLLIEEASRQHRAGDLRVPFGYKKHSLLLFDEASGRAIRISRMQDGSLEVVDRVDGQDGSRAHWSRVPETGAVWDGERTWTVHEAVRSLAARFTLQIVHDVDNMQG